MLLYHNFLQCVLLAVKIKTMFWNLPCSRWTRVWFPGQVRPKYFKSWYSQLTCLTLSIYKGLCGDRPASLLVVSLGKTLNGIASTFEWLDW